MRIVAESRGEAQSAIAIEWREQMSIPVIDLEYFGQPADIYCPVCGMPIYAHGEMPSCEHVVFTFLNDLGEFDYVMPDLQEQADSVMERADDEDID